MSTLQVPQSHTFSGYITRVLTAVLFIAMATLPVAPAFADDGSEMQSIVTESVIAEAAVLEEDEVPTLQVAQESTSEETTDSPVDTELVSDVDTDTEVVPVHEEAIVDAEDVVPEVLYTEKQDAAEMNALEEHVSGDVVDMSEASTTPTETQIATTTQQVSETQAAATTTATDNSTSTSAHFVASTTHNAHAEADAMSSESAAENVATSTDYGTSTAAAIDAHAATTTTKTATTTIKEVIIAQSEDAAATPIKKTDTNHADDTQPVSTTTSESATSTPDTNSATTTVATTTITHVVPHGSYAVNDGNRYQFSQTECVSVGDGSFYCTEAESDKPHEEDRVYAAPDSDGDYEIFIRKDGVNHKITDNTIDDLAPFYDATSNRLVWHALIKDRYQIFAYDLQDATHTQVTDTRFNNMEPSAFGSVTVWQAWVKNSWEVMLLDGDTVIQLTDNDVHDIAPHIRNNYVIWQAQDGTDWKVRVYDMDTTEITTIDAGAGTLVENPRFVLVYDSTDANGDIHTLGYDFDTKESITLESTPAPLPNKIPEPDQTGEIRAIIQKKPTNEDDIELLPFDTTPDSDPPDPAATSTIVHATTTADIVVSPYIPTDTDAKEMMHTTEPSEETRHAEAAVAHIPDIVIQTATTTSTSTQGV